MIIVINLFKIKLIMRMLYFVIKFLMFIKVVDPKENQDQFLLMKRIGQVPIKQIKLSKCTKLI